MTDLTGLLPPPPSARPVDWDAVGVRLPSDYRAYIDTYGLGSISDLFWVLHPYGSPDRLNLLDQWNAPPGPLLTPPPYPVGPGGLLPCVTDEDAGLLYWHAADPDPDRWTVVYRDEDGDGWYPYPLTLTAFLAAVLTGDLPELGFTDLPTPPYFTPLP